MAINLSRDICPVESRAARRPQLLHRPLLIRIQGRIGNRRPIQLGQGRFELLRGPAMAIDHHLRKLLDLFLLRLFERELRTGNLEGIARRDFSMQVKEKMLLAGFVVLMMLMVTVIYNDLTRISWVENLMFWR